jgi:hypothetical protein
MTASLGIRVIRSSLVDWRPMKKECRHAAQQPTAKNRKSTKNSTFYLEVNKIIFAIFAPVAFPVFFA